MSDRIDDSRKWPVWLGLNCQRIEMQLRNNDWNKENKSQRITKILFYPNLANLFRCSSSADRLLLLKFSYSWKKSRVDFALRRWRSCSRSWNSWIILNSTKSSRQKSIFGNWKFEVNIMCLLERKACIFSYKSGKKIFIVSWKISVNFSGNAVSIIINQTW